MSALSGTRGVGARLIPEGARASLVQVGSSGSWGQLRTDACWSVGNCFRRSKGGRDRSANGCVRALVMAPLSLCTREVHWNRTVPLCITLLMRSPRRLSACGGFVLTGPQSMTYSDSQRGRIERPRELTECPNARGGQGIGRVAPGVSKRKSESAQKGYFVPLAWPWW